MTLNDYSQCGKFTIADIYDRGNLQKFEQVMRIELLKGFPQVSQKASISISTTNPRETVPRSFRTADPKTLRKIIASLIRCLHCMEADINGTTG